MGAVKKQGKRTKKEQRKNLEGSKDENKRKEERNFCRKFAKTG